LQTPPTTLSSEAALLAAIVESSDDAIVSKDLNGTVTSWNKGAVRMFGYTADEMIHRPITTIIPPELQAEEVMILGKIRAGERIEHFQTVRLRKNGERIDVSLSISPITDHDGRVIGAAKIARDITRKIKTEHDSQRLAAIVESSDDGIVSKDLNGIVASWNKAAERMFGYKAEEIIGKSIMLIIPPELQQDEIQILAKLKAGEKIDHFHTVRVRKDGERLDVSLTISPVKDEHGKLIGAAKILRDITEQKKLELALHTSERLASVGRLAATVAHEINNPLEAIMNYIYLARHDPGLSEKSRGYLVSADRELVRVAHIAQQTLGFYRNSSKPVTLQIAKIIEEVLAIYERKLKSQRVTVKKEIEPGLKIVALEGELKQVLSNLLTNAIDASKDGGVIAIRARATGHLHCDKAGVRITIADNGTGIAAENKQRLFTPFFTTKKTLGTGLGLWITRDLLRKRGGNIRIHSSDHGVTGTAMSIFLPQQPTFISTEQAG
jgi:PAS domain S-box-containing protein